MYPNQAQLPEFSTTVLASLPQNSFIVNSALKTHWHNGN